MGGTPVRVASGPARGSVRPRRLRRWLTTSLAVVLLAGVLGSTGGQSAEAATVVGAGTVENTSAAITYSGTWTTATSSSDSGGSTATLNTIGSASLTFRETSVSWVARTGNYLGIATVYLDDVEVATVDLYSAALTQRTSVYTARGLTDGEHTLRIERTGLKTAASPGKGISVDAFVVHDSQPPAAPTELRSTATGSSAELAWRANSEPDLAGYRVYRSSDGTTYRALTSEPITATSYTDPALMPNTTYRYRVTAVDRNGQESPRSDETSLASAATAVGAGTFENTASEVSLVGPWTTTSSVSDNGGTVSLLASPGFAQLAFRETSVQWVARTGDSFGIANVYLDGNLVTTVDLYSASLSQRKVVYASPTLPDGIHSLRIERTGLKNDASTGKGINLDSFVVPDTHAPAAPVGLTGTLEGSGARLRWSASPADDLAGYRVYRAVGTSTSFEPVVTVSASTTTVLDPGHLPQTSYHYRVAALDRAGNESARSAAVTVESAATAVADGTVESSSDGYVRTGTWTTSTGRLDSGGSVSLLNTTGYAQLSFTESSVTWIARTANYLGIAKVYLDGALVATVDLYSPSTAYKVAAYSSPPLPYGTHTLRIERTGTKNAASSGKSINVDAFLVPDSRPPASPTRLTASPQGPSVRLGWADNPEPDVAGYRVYRASGPSGDFEALTTEPLRDNGYVDPDLTPDSDYRYRITALDRTGNQSPASTVASVRTAVGPGTYQSGSGAVRLTGNWTPVSDPDGSGGAVHSIASSGSASLTFNESSVRWIGTKGPTGGIAQVSVDGGAPTPVNQYSSAVDHQVALFERTGLGPGSHTITVSWTSAADDAVTGTPRTVVDAFEVADTTAPEAPQVVWAGASGAGIVVAWAQSVDDDAVGYLVYRARDSDGIFTLVTSEPTPDTQLVDEGLDPGTAYRYRVRAVDRSGNESELSTTATATTAVSTGTVQNTSPALRYSTPWTTSTSSLDSGGSVASLTTPGSVQLTFSGTGITFVTRTNNYSGIARVVLDGVAVAEVDLYSPTARFRQQVFSKLTLPDGTHTIRIERTGLKHPSSTGKGVSLDSLVVLDSQAPPAMPAPTLSSSRLGIALTWPASPAPDVAAYRLYRSTAADPDNYREIDRLPPSQLSHLDIGLPDATQYSYRVTAIDTSNNESVSTAPAAIRTPSAPAPVSQRFANCPPPTRTVTSTSTLRNALSQAGPGDVIWLSPGTYTGYFSIGTRASAAAPVWVCGPRTAVLDFGDVSSGYGFLLDGASHVTVTGMTIRNVQKGVTVAGGSHVTVSDIRLESIGDEAIHLRSNTTDSTVVGNVIRTTGLLTPAYGEGVYVGSDPSNWCTYSACQPDRSSRNSVLDNDIAGTTAEGLEVKAGAIEGVVQGNRIDGSAMTATHSGGWVVIKGNSWLVRSNTGVTAPENGYQATFSKVRDWGRDNVFVANRATLNNPTGVGVWVQKYIGNRVACSNTATETTRVTNVACQN